MQLACQSPALSWRAKAPAILCCEKSLVAISVYAAHECRCCGCCLARKEDRAAKQARYDDDEEDAGAGGGASAAGVVVPGTGLLTTALHWCSAWPHVSTPGFLNLSLQTDNVDRTLLP